MGDSFFIMMKILRDALKEFTNNTGLKIEVDKYYVNNPEIDVELKLRVKNDEIKFCGQIKNWMTKNTVGHILHHIEKYKCTVSQYCLCWRHCAWNSYKCSYRPKENGLFS